MNSASSASADRSDRTAASPLAEPFMRPRRTLEGLARVAAAVAQRTGVAVRTDRAAAALETGASVTLVGGVLLVPVWWAMDRGGRRQPEILVFFVIDGTGQLGEAGERRGLARAPPMAIMKLRRCMRAPEKVLAGRSPQPDIAASRRRRRISAVPNLAAMRPRGSR